jgi:DNA-binding NarL/FixJ family response regulator
VGPGTERLVRDLQPDILLLGYLSSGAPAVEMLERLAASAVSVRTILLVKSIDTPEIVAALRFGACGVLVRDSTADLLFKSIDAVMAGRYWIGRECAPGNALANVRRLDHSPGDAQRFGLTHRELEIVRGIVNGETNREIAARLAISDNTVKRHIMNVFNKVGCSSRVELALFAAYHRLLRER